MKRASKFFGCASLALVLAPVATAGAAQKVRLQVNQHGDFAWIGNSSAQDCAAIATTPTVGTLNKALCGTNIDDTSPDVFWRADDPAAGEATAVVANSAANARSTALLRLPAGAVVTHARLYWGGQVATNTPDTTVTIGRRGGFSSNLTADASYSVLKTGTNNVYWYESSVDVTDLVQTNGIGTYRVSGINSVNLVDLDSPDPFVAWSLAVFYRLDSDPERNLALFDGLDQVSSGNPVNVPIAGFLVPNSGWDAKLGVLAYEGDQVFNGDSLIFNGHTLTDGVNPADNFFNSSRSWLGTAVSVVGDLPQLDGKAASMSGLDLDVVDVTTFVSPGQTSATIQATSVGDAYMIGAFATSIATFQPNFSTTAKTFTDVNGGQLVRGDVVQYTIVATNTGNDTATKVVLRDPLPAGLTYVANTINVTQGSNVGSKSDAAGNDQGEYDAATRAIVVRLGQGADGTSGGSMAPSATTTITFRAQVNVDAVTPISNQAIVNAAGLKGDPATNYPSGNGARNGAPTTFNFDECTTNTDCKVAAKPVCNATATPKVCVACLADATCGSIASGRVCSAALACVDGCRGTGGNGCPVNQSCSSATAVIGTCSGPLDAGLRDASLDGANLSDGATGDAANASDGATGDSANESDGMTTGPNGSDAGGNTDGAADSALGDGATGAGGAAGRDAATNDAALDGALAEGRDSGADGESEGGASADASLGDAAAFDGGKRDASGARTDGGDALDDGSSVEGGGCACSVPGQGTPAPTRSIALGIAVGITAWARRRRGTRAARAE